MKPLEKLAAKVSRCTKCDLCKTRTNAVPGRGNINAKIMFVGEAPGKTEDLKAEPFVGPAGKKLTSLLEKNGILRSSAYITNVVKCRPPLNRIPTKKETEACRNYLEAEIKLVNPIVICVLGNTACKSLLGIRDITKNHGRIFKKEGRRYFATFHPAAVIYNKKLNPMLQKDIKKLKLIISKNES